MSRSRNRISRKFAIIYDALDIYKTREGWKYWFDVSVEIFKLMERGKI